MTLLRLKSATPPRREHSIAVPEAVAGMLREIEAGGAARALAYARDLDGWQGDPVLSETEIAAASARVDPQVQADLRFAHGNIRRFAEAQRATLTDMDIEMAPGFRAGQRSIPVAAAGCYAPGGRFSHVADDGDDGTRCRGRACDRLLATARDAGPGR